MVLRLGMDTVLKSQTDVRENPVIDIGGLKILYQEMQEDFQIGDLNATGPDQITRWVDVPGVAIGFSIAAAQNVVIIGNTNGLGRGATFQDARRLGVETRIKIDTTVKTNSTRNGRIYLAEGVNSVQDKLGATARAATNLYVEESLAAGDYVVFLQARIYSWGDTSIDVDSGMAKGASLMVMLTDIGT